MLKIKNVIDKYFAFMEEIGGNSYIEELIPISLINQEKESKYSGTKFWKPIKSNITDLEILKLERVFGHKLPNSYIFFLQYVHFIELVLGKDSISFFKNLPSNLIQNFQKEIESKYKDLVNRNYLPFARMGENAILCFDANNDKGDNNYQIVSFEENEFSYPEDYSIDFQTMFYEFEIHLNNWINNKRSNNAT